MVDVEDDGDALLVLLGLAADVVVQLGDGEEGVGEVDVVKVELLQHPPDQPVLNYLPNLEAKHFKSSFYFLIIANSN